MVLLLNLGFALKHGFLYFLLLTRGAKTGYDAELNFVWNPGGEYGQKDIFSRLDDQSWSQSAVGLNYFDVLRAI